MPSGAMIGVGLVLTILLGLAVREIRTQDKEMAVLEMAKALQDQEIQHRKEMGKAVVDAQTIEQGKIALLQADLDFANNDLLRKTIHAEYNAQETPMAFGDEFVRDLIRLDCLWSLGPSEGDIPARAACVREARLADTTNSIVPVAVVTPEFRVLWYDACDDWSGIGTSTGVINYTEEDWKAEYGSFDSKLCHQTTVVFTPAFSYYLRDFLNKREGYTAKLANHAIANRTLLDVVTKPRPPVDTSKN